MSPTRHLIAAAVIVLLASNAPDSQAQTRTAAAGSGGPTADLLRQLQMRSSPLARAYVQLNGQQAAPESDSQPQNERSDESLMPLVLPQTLAVVDQAIGTAPTVMLGALQAARRGLATANERLHEGSRDASPQFLVGVLNAMAEGQTGLGQALDIASGISPVQMGLLLPAVQKVREAARRTQVDLLDLAAAAGVAPARLDPVRAALRQGDALHLKGSYGAAVSQYALGLGLAANTVVFDMGRFEQNLRSVFDNQTVGWSYALSQGGQLVRQGQMGLARSGADLPQTAQSSAKKMHIASVSKTFTAILTLRLLAERGLTPNAAIGPFLPQGWARGTGVDNITFRQLMTHRSGFGQNAPGKSSYADLQAMVALNVPFKGVFDYDNANFGLLRVVIAVMLGADPQWFPLDPGAFTAAVFQVHAQARFDSIGVPYSCEPAAGAPTLQYNFPDTANPGYVEPSRGLACGGFGVFISAEHLARTLAYLRYTQDLLAPASLQQMKTGYMGFMDPANNYNFAQGKFGVYHTHGGDWDHTGWGGLDACVMMFPINVEASVLINSSRKAAGGSYSNGGYQCSVIKWAFENAWAAN